MAVHEDYDYQILRLSDKFYQNYPNPPFAEILKKPQRAYDCLLLQTHYNYYICVPYRTEITHSYAYHFRKSARSRKHHSGLDYSKLVIIDKPEYIEDKIVIIDHDEYIETVVNMDRIRREACEYVESYCRHITGEKKMHVSEFQRTYRYSPLKYFHKELGLEVVKSAVLC